MPARAKSTRKYKARRPLAAKVSRKTKKKYKKLVSKRFKRSHPKDQFTYRELPVSSVGQHSGYNNIKLTCDMSVKGRSKAASGKLIYRETYCRTLSSLVGKQNHIELWNALTYFQVMDAAAIGGASAGLDIRASGLSLLSLQPNRKHTGSADPVPLDGTQTVLISGSSQNDSICIRSVDFVMDIVNASNHGAYVDVEIYVCKRDTNISVFQQSADLISGQGLMGAAPFFDTASIQGVPAAITNSGTATLETPGMRVSNASGLNTYWKKCSGRSLYIASAAQQRFSGNIILNKIIKESDFVGKSATAFIKGYSIHCVARVLGQVVINTSVANPFPTYGGASLGCVTQVVYNVGTVKNPAGRLSANFATNGLTINVSNVAQDIVDVEGAIADYIPIA